MEAMHAHGAHALAASAPADAAPPVHHAPSHHEAAFTWRPTVDTADCRFRGLTAHALLLGALAMFVLPHAVARANAGRAQGAAAAMFVGACVSNAMQRTCRAHGAPSALVGGNLHAVLGWSFVTAVGVMSVALPRLTQPAVAAMDAAVSSACAVVLGATSRLRSWLLIAALVLGILLLLTGVWSTLNCYDSPGFVGYEIGHLVPASMWIGTGAAALRFRRAGAQLDLQRLEGRLSLALGSLFLTEITIAHGGGMFSSTGGTHHDQQHQSSGLLYVASGALALALAHQGVATGAHMLLPAIGQAIMIMSHAQFSEQSALMHQAHAGLLLVSALWRCARRIHEYSLFAALSGAAFIGSSECPVRFAEDVGFNAAGYALCIFAAAAGLWAWSVHLAIDDKAPGPLDERRARKLAGRSDTAPPLDDDV